MLKRLFMHCARNTAYIVAGIVLGAAVFAYASDEGYFLAESDHMERSDGSIQILVFPIRDNRN